MKTLVDNPKPPFQLYREKDGVFTPTLTVLGSAIWVCGECGTLYSRFGSEDDPRKKAEECCKQTYCGCGAKVEYYRTECSDCWSNKTTNARLEKAVEIEDFDGPVFMDSGDQYWSDVGEFLDWVADQVDDEDEESIPEWIYPCKVRGFRKHIDAYDLIENELSDHYEDAVDAVEDLDGLQKYLDEWCAKQTLQSWDPDYSRKINVAKLRAKDGRNG